jgi:hypothetical protein
MLASTTASTGATLAQPAVVCDGARCSLAKAPANGDVLAVVELDGGADLAGVIATDSLGHQLKPEVITSNCASVGRCVAVYDEVVAGSPGPTVTLGTDSSYRTAVYDIAGAQYPGTYAAVGTSMSASTLATAIASVHSGDVQICGYLQPHNSNGNVALTFSNGAGTNDATGPEPAIAHAFATTSAPSTCTAGNLSPLHSAAGIGYADYAAAASTPATSPVPGLAQAVAVCTGSEVCSLGQAPANGDILAVVVLDGSHNLANTVVEDSLGHGLKLQTISPNCATVGHCAAVFDEAVSGSPSSVVKINDPSAYRIAVYDVARASYPGKYASNGTTGVPASLATSINAVAANDVQLCGYIQPANSTGNIGLSISNGTTISDVSGPQPAIVHATAGSSATSTCTSTNINPKNSAGLAFAAYGTASANPTYSGTVQGDRPFVYYRFNESSGTTFADSSGNGHAGSAVFTVAFRQGSLIKGDASANSVGFANGYAQEFVTYSPDAVTAEAWIRPTAADLGSTYSPRLIGNAWTDNSGKGYMLWIDGGRAKFFAGYSEMIDPVPLVAGQVYHLVGTYDYNGTPYTTHFYVNGVLVGQNWSQTPQVEAGDTAATNIGVLDARSPGPGYVDHFQGAMGDVAVYDYALSAQQAVTHYNVGAQTSLPVPTPIPPTPTPSPPPTPMPLGTPIAYNATSACIYHTVYANNVLPAGEGEFGANGLDRTWWGRYRGDGTSTSQLGNWVSGVSTSTWGRTQYNTYFGDKNDGLPGGHDPFYYGPDTGAPGSPKALRITANVMFPNLVGNPGVDGEPFYAGMLMTPVKLTYGFIVARLRTPAPGPGLSPAFWVLQGQGVKAGPHGNLSDEWDIQEMFGSDVGNGMNQGELIWNSAAIGDPVQNWGGSYNSLPNGAIPSADYHDYGVLISPGGAPISSNDNGSGGPGLTYGDPSTGGTFFVDGQPVYGHTGGADINLTATSPGYKEIMAMFQVSSSGWLGGASSADLPASYWLQWIRVYRPTSAHC